jgi:hypothetical protein
VVFYRGILQNLTLGDLPQHRTSGVNVQPLTRDSIGRGLSLFVLVQCLRVIGEQFTLGIKLEGTQKPHNAALGIFLQSRFLPAATATGTNGSEKIAHSTTLL